MWIKRSDRIQLIGDDIARSEITPQHVFENRRRVLQAAGAWRSVADRREWRSVGGVTRRTRKRRSWRQDQRQIRRARQDDAVQGHHHVQQLLRIRHRQSRSGAKRRDSAAASVEGERRRRDQESEGVRHRRIAQARAARRARLPDALRRGLVDGDSLDRLSARGIDQARAADRQRQIRAVHHPGRSLADAGTRRRPCSTGRTPKACAWTRR